MRNSSQARQHTKHHTHISFFCSLSCWYDWISFVCTQNNSLQNVYFLLCIYINSQNRNTEYNVNHTYSRNLKNGLACEYENKWYIPFNLTMKNLWCFPMWNECLYLRTSGRISMRAREKGLTKINDITVDGFTHKSHSFHFELDFYFLLFPLSNEKYEKYWKWK